MRGQGWVSSGWCCHCQSYCFWLLELLELPELFLLLLFIFIRAGSGGVAGVV